MSIVFVKLMDSDNGKKLYNEIRNHWENKDILKDLFPKLEIIENKDMLLHSDDNFFIQAKDNCLFCELYIEDIKVNLILTKVDTVWKLKIEQDTTNSEKIPGKMRNILPKNYWSNYSIRDFDIYQIDKNIYIDENISCIWIKGITKISSK
jgi:hypothetical protein